MSTDTKAYTVLPSFDDIDDSELLGLGSSSHGGSGSLTPTIPAENKDGASDASALFHVVCVIAGTGILQLPLALSNAGWIGVGIMIAAAFVNEYTGRLLIQCLYADGRRLTGYPDIGYVAYGKTGRGIVNFFYNSVLLGVTCLYLILAGMEIYEFTGLLSKKLWIVICAAVISAPFLFLRSLKEVTIVSLFGALASVGLVCIVFVLGIVDFPNHQGKVEHSFFEWRSLATAIGTIAFSFGGNFVYPEVEHSMKKPAHFPQVLRKAMFVITIMYLMSAVVGYATYGTSVLSPIINNLPEGIPKQTAIVIVTLHVLLACPVLMTTFSLDMERALKIDAPVDTPKQILYRSGLRITSIIGVAAVACAIPFFEHFMTLIGSVSNTMLIFVFPILFHYKLYGSERVTLAEHISRFSIVAIGVLAGIVGGSQAIYNLYNAFYQN